MRRPSPALVIALIALAGAWGGPAVAQSLIGGKQVRNESLTSADLKNRSVRGRDLRSNTVTGRNVEGLTGRDVLRNGLDGSDIDEDTLEAVPNATRAARATRADAADRAGTAAAIDRTQIVRLAYAEAAATPAVTLFEGGGLVIQARCTDTGTLVVRAAPSGSTGGIIRADVAREGGSSLEASNDFGGDASIDLVAGGADNLTGTLTYWSPNGDVVTAQYLAQESLPLARGFRCAVAGTAVHTIP